MKEDKHNKHEGFIKNMITDIVDENLISFIPELHNSEFNSPQHIPQRGDHLTFSNSQSPLNRRFGHNMLPSNPNIDNLTVRSDLMDNNGLSTIFNENPQNFTLAKLFADGEQKPVTPSKVEEAAHRSDDEDDDEGSENGKMKFNKGLKRLSIIVQEIVVKKQSTTYKEVASMILHETRESGNLQISSKIELAKEEQNIKRRVYDALNVLISAGILIKEGKKVRKNEVNKKIKISSKQMTIKSLRSTIQQKKIALDKKLAQLNNITKEYEGLKRLIERNKQQPSQSYISCPFILVKPSDEMGTNLKIVKQEDSLKFALYSNREFTVYGDMEVIAKISANPMQNQ